MYFYVWPADGLSTVSGNPRLEDRVHKQLIQSRQVALETLRDQILASITSHVRDPQTVKQTIGVCPGIGKLLFNDDFVKVAWLEAYRGRRLRVFPVLPLPKWSPIAPMKKKAPAQPWHLALIHRPSAHKGTGIKIGMIDTGYDPAYPDFQGTFAATFTKFKPGTLPKMQSAPAQELATPKPHGTWSLAVCAGQTTGVAPNAKLFVAAIPAHIATIDNPPLFETALDWLIVQGCDIITTSVFTGNEGAIPSTSIELTSLVPTLTSVDHSLSEARNVHKMFVVGAIGNSPNLGKFQHPGSSTHVTGVGAVNPSAILSGSAWGYITPGPGVVNKPDFVAPGNGIQVPNKTNGHDSVSGTSFAAPIFAGAAALVIEKHGTLRGNPSGLLTKMMTLVQPVAGTPPANSTGKGLLDLTTM